MVQSPVGDLDDILVSKDEENFITIEGSKVTVWDADSKVQIGHYNFDFGVGPYSGKVSFTGLDNILLSADNRIIKLDFIKEDTSEFISFSQLEFVTAMAIVPSSDLKLIIATKIYPNLNSRVMDKTNEGRLLLVSQDGKIEQSRKIKTEITAIEVYKDSPIAVFGNFNGAVEHISLKDLSTVNKDNITDIPIQSINILYDKAIITESIYSNEFSRYGISRGNLHLFSDFGNSYSLTKMPYKNAILTEKQIERYEEFIGKYDNNFVSNAIKDIRLFNNKIIISFAFSSFFILDPDKDEKRWFDTGFPYVNSMNTHKGNLILNDGELFVDITLKDLLPSAGSRLIYFNYEQNRVLQSIEGGSKLKDQNDMFFSDLNYPPLFGLNSRSGYPRSDTLTLFPLNRTNAIQLVCEDGNLQWDRRSGYFFLTNKEYNDLTGKRNWRTRHNIICASLNTNDLKDGRSYVRVKDGGAYLLFSDSVNSKPYFELKVEKIWDLNKGVEASSSEISFGEFFNCTFIPDKNLLLATYVGNNKNKKKYTSRVNTIAQNDDGSFKIFMDVVRYVISSDNRLLALQTPGPLSNEQEVIVYNIQDFQKIFSFPSYQFYKFAFDRNRNVLFYTRIEDKKTVLYSVDLDDQDPSEQLVLPEVSFNSFDSDIENNKVIVYDYDNLLVLDSIYNAVDTLNIQDVNSVDVTSNGNFAITAYDQSYLLNNQDQLIQFLLYEELKYGYILENGYYHVDRTVLKDLGYKLRNQGFLSYQLDSYLNRPDLVYKAIAQSQDQYYSLLNKAVLKRISRAGLSELDINKLMNQLPETELSDIPAYQSDSLVQINIQATDVTGLSKIKIMVNGVPLHGRNHFALIEEPIEFDSVFTIPLSLGENQIEVSVLNTNGIESIRKRATIICDKSYQKKDLYLVSVSVSEYEHKDYNLSYATKDGREIIQLFEQSDLFDSIHSRVLFDGAVNKGNFHDLKTFLANSKVDDHVILFLSGHGVLDKEFNFYFAPYNMNFKDPGLNGISYEEIDYLLDSIPSRHKVLFMDTCHSGEVDMGIQDYDSLLIENNVLATWQYKGAVGEAEKAVMTLNSSFELMQELFSNLTEQSGSFVISAAAGNSYALEGEEWQNGVFTYSLKKGLGAGNSSPEADLDRDGSVTVNELYSYVSKEVVRLTNGRQKPTSRSENLENNFVVWSVVE